MSKIEKRHAWGRKELDELIRGRTKELPIASGDRVMASLTCSNHPRHPSLPIYEDGVIFIRCVTCFEIAAVVRVADEGCSICLRKDADGAVLN